MCIPKFVMSGSIRLLCCRPVICSGSVILVAGCYYSLQILRCYTFDAFIIFIFILDVCELLKIYFLLFNIAKILLSEAI